MIKPPVSNLPLTEFCTTQPRYMENLMRAAAQRRLDHQQAEQRMLEKEREAEGDQFDDKEIFVTAS